MVICLERGADLHMAQLMPLLLTVSCFSKTRVVPEKGRWTGVCVCVLLGSTDMIQDNLQQLEHSVKNLRILLKQCFTAGMSLLTASRAFWLVLLSDVTSTISTPLSFTIKSDFYFLNIRDNCKPIPIFLHSYEQQNLHVFTTHVTLFRVFKNLRKFKTAISMWNWVST